MELGRQVLSCKVQMAAQQMYPSRRAHLGSTQSRCAIISSLARGLKVSRPRPRASRAGRAWGGINWAFISGAIESSTKKKKTVLVNGVHSVHNRRAIYHVVRSRKEQGDPWRGCCGDGNPVVGCWGHEAHRRRGDTSPPRQTTVVSECIPEGQR